MLSSYFYFFFWPYLFFIREIFIGVNRFFHFDPAKAGKTPWVKPFYNDSDTLINKVS